MKYLPSNHLLCQSGRTSAKLRGTFSRSSFRHCQRWEKKWRHSGGHCDNITNNEARSQIHGKTLQTTHLPHILCFSEIAKNGFLFKREAVFHFETFEVGEVLLLLGFGPLFSFYLLIIGDVRQKRVFTCHDSVSTAPVMHLWIMKWPLYRCCY